jgi:hypothetical protein
MTAQFWLGVLVGLFLGANLGLLVFGILFAGRKDRVIHVKCKH